MECLNFYDSENEFDEVKYMLITDDDDENQIFLYPNFDKENEPKDERNEKDKGIECNQEYQDDNKRQEEDLIQKPITYLPDNPKESADEALNGNSRYCIFNPVCYFQNTKKAVEYVQSVVLVGQHDKFTKTDKVVAFQILCEYILKMNPDLEHDHKFRKLSRNEKRMVPKLNERFYEISSYIYEIFQTEQKEEIILKILRQIDLLLIQKLEIEVLAKPNEKKKTLIKKYKEELEDIEKKMLERAKLKNANNNL